MTVAFVYIALLFSLVVFLLGVLVLVVHRHGVEAERARDKWDEERRDLLDRIQAPEARQWKVAAEAAPPIDPTEFDRQVQEAFDKNSASVVPFDSDLMD